MNIKNRNTLFLAYANMKKKQKSNSEVSIREVCLNGTADSTFLKR